MTQSVFHIDEQRAQWLAGFDSVSSSGIRSAMPQQHRDFFAGLPMLFIATLDPQGWPVASVLSGTPGFISSYDPRHLRINAPRRADCPALATLAVGKPLAALGLDFSNRRRNRANGHLTRMDKNRLEIEIEQSFGNCPQYIQQRQLIPLSRQPAAISHLPTLDNAASTMLQSADTFFVATHAHGGADISHRGGNPGFIKRQGDTLWIPDFRGNRYMNTLGNMLAEPRAALLFLDFNNGDVLHLQGRTEIRWQKENLPNFDGAERFWCLHIERAWRFAAWLPWRADAAEFSPATRATGTWDTANQQ